MDILEQQLYVIKESLISKDGEVVELHPDAEKQITQDLIYINKVKNKEEKERKKAFYDMQKVKTEFQEFISEELGNFYFNFYNKIPKEVERQYKFRFIYLCCYLKYDDPQNRLVIGNTKGKRFLLEKELMNILKLKKTEYSYTKRALIQHGLIVINEDKTISINSNYSFKGKLNKKVIRTDFTRIFENSIKEIYEKSLAIEHKRIALLIEFLPYCNYNHNILCYNPEEENINLLNLIDLKDLCVLMGYTRKNYNKFKNELLKITVNKEYAILISLRGKIQIVTINPRIFYKGNNINDLKNIIGYFDIKE